VVLKQLGFWPLTDALGCRLPNVSRITFVNPDVNYSTKFSRAPLFRTRTPIVCSRDNKRVRARALLHVLRPNVTAGCCRGGVFRQGSNAGRGGREEGCFPETVGRTGAVGGVYRIGKGRRGRPIDPLTPQYTRRSARPRNVSATDPS